MPKNKTIELWDGYSVEVREELLDDMDFLEDLNAVIQTNDLHEVIAMHFALVGGEKVYDDAREYITQKCGRFSAAELRKIVNKIGECFPKDGNRASRRHDWTSR